MEIKKNNIYFNNIENIIFEKTRRQSQKLQGKYRTKMHG